MATKKHTPSETTTFILGIPVDEALKRLTERSSFFVDVNPDQGGYILKVSDPDWHGSSSLSIYVTLKSWNNTDTLVTVGSDNPAENPLMTQGKRRLWTLFEILAPFVVALLVAPISSGLPYVAFWVTVLIVLYVRGGDHYFYRKEMDETNSIILVRERLTNVVVKHLTQNVDVQLIRE